MKIALKADFFGFRLRTELDSELYYDWGETKEHKLQQVDLRCITNSRSVFPLCFFWPELLASDDMTTLALMY